MAGKQFFSSECGLDQLLDLDLLKYVCEGDDDLLPVDILIWENWCGAQRETSAEGLDTAKPRGSALLLTCLKTHCLVEGLSYTAWLPACCILSIPAEILSLQFFS